MSPTFADPHARKLTMADAMQLGHQLSSFRATHLRTDAGWLRRFGFLRLWHAQTHRKKWGASYRAVHVELMQEAHEAFRLARENGKVLP